MFVDFLEIVSFDDFEFVEFLFVLISVIDYDFCEFGCIVVWFFFD